MASKLERMERTKAPTSKKVGGTFADQNIADGSALSPASILWDDPLLLNHLLDRRAQWATMEKHYAELAVKLKPHTGQANAGKIKHAQLIAETLSAKIGLTRRLFSAYAAGDRRQLAAVRRGIAPLVRRLECTADSLRSNWMARNKPFGFEGLELRMAGVTARYKELDRRLAAYLAGPGHSIPELDEIVTGPWR